MQEVEEFKEKPRIALTVSCYSLWWGLPLSDSYTLSSTQGLTAKTNNQITSQAGLLYKEEWLLKMPGSWIPCPHHYPISSTVTSGSLDPWNALGLWCLAMGHPNDFWLTVRLLKGYCHPAPTQGTPLRTRWCWGEAGEEVAVSITAKEKAPEAVPIHKGDSSTLASPCWIPFILENECHLSIKYWRNSYLSRLHLCLYVSTGNYKILLCYKIQMTFKMPSRSWFFLGLSLWTY